MIFKKISQLTPAQWDKISYDVRTNFICRDKEYWLEIIASEQKLNDEATHSIYTTCVIYDESTKPEKIMNHIVYLETLTKRQCENLLAQVNSNPDQFLFPNE